MSQYDYIPQCYELKLNNNLQWSMQGHSKAGERTGFNFKPLNFTIDGGLASLKPCKAIFVTHSHCDHTLNLPRLINKRTLNIHKSLRGVPIICHPAIEHKIHRLMHVTHVLSKDYDECECININDTKVLELQQSYHMFPMAPSNEMYDIPTLPNIKIEILQAHHALLKCNGYGFNYCRKKVKSEYKNTPKNEFINLKKQGIEFTEIIIEPQIVFFCDSTIDNLKLHNEWKKYPVVICECTGYEPYQTKEHMYNIDHNHIDDLLPIMLEHIDKQWILIHSSMAINDEWLSLKEQELKDMDLNVFIWRDSFY